MKRGLISVIAFCSALIVVGCSSDVKQKKPPYTEPTTGMEFVYVLGGCFKMGHPKSEKLQKQHRVCVHNGGGFWVGKYEVTQAQWEKIMGSNPSDFKGADRPVEQVSWNDAQAFLQKLNATAGAGSEPALTFRLPTESEWEYAARAGTQTDYSFGDDPAQLGDYAWYLENSGHQTHPVGQKQPNDFGLHEMYGNVWEWCQDWHDETYYVKSPKDNPQGPSSGYHRLLRGGSWGDGPDVMHSAFRYRSVPDRQFSDIGFRVVAVSR